MRSNENVMRSNENGASYTNLLPKSK